MTGVSFAAADGTNVVGMVGAFVLGVYTGIGLMRLALRRK